MHTSTIFFLQPSLPAPNFLTETSGNASSQHTSILLNALANTITKSLKKSLKITYQVQHSRRMSELSCNVMITQLFANLSLVVAQGQIYGYQMRLEISNNGLMPTERSYICNLLSVLLRWGRESQEWGIRWDSTFILKVCSYRIIQIGAPSWCSHIRNLLRFFGLKVAQGHMKDPFNETRTQSWRFAGLAG